MDSWMNGNPPGTAYNVTQSGWMEDYVFESWFETIFLKWVEGKPKSILVYLDGHGSHLTYQTTVKAKSAGVHVICLPPHTLRGSSLLILLCTKKAWYGILTNFYRESVTGSLDYIPEQRSQAKVIHHTYCD